VRILAVVPLYPPGSRVGAWLATHACLAHLVALGHDVDVVTTLHTSRFAYEIDGVRVHPRADPSTFDGVDVLVSHLGDDQTPPLLAARWGVPSVRMVHGSHPDNAANLAASPCSLAVFNSSSLAAETNHPGPSIVVHPPFDPDAVRCTPGGRVTLVNLCEPKGGAVFWQLARTMPHAQFLGVRGGYGRQVSDKRKNVRVIDQTPDMAGDVYAKTRVLLMPSSSETWGMVGLEAMVSGIPVVAHPTPGLRESLGSAAIFVDRTDLKGWQEAITDLLRPSAWTKASSRAAEHASTYDPAPDLARFAAAIEDVASVGVAA
jgi:hypothetical protein